MPGSVSMHHGNNYSRGCAERGQEEEQEEEQQ